MPLGQNCAVLEHLQGHLLGKDEDFLLAMTQLKTTSSKTVFVHIPSTEERIYLGNSTLGKTPNVGPAW